jgi:hypothetical protein
MYLCTMYNVHILGGIRCKRGHRRNHPGGQEKELYNTKPGAHH